MGIEVGLIWKEFRGMELIIKTHCTNSEIIKKNAHNFDAHWYLGVKDSALHMCFLDIQSYRLCPQSTESQVEF